ncbi:hypothetical protein OC835_002682 [Tilletia horrida]|uniref:Small ribosomal subunit protein mS29 n=1 Tax=Tilletia horrida TaxID=155126 RepID=A0AAN6G6E9_9BASI|nr:hypothetical protein OC842_005974 [Tilletia horrida]KAK0534403.1 hypothetical protein OC835_002682 [Tilletia horrida]KAK0552861.1 hypothetical protein OC844_006381 [Tilletia horrida]
MHALLLRRAATVLGHVQRAAAPSAAPAASAALFSSASVSAAAAKKAAPVKKKKVAIKKKSTSSGPRGEGGRRKGGSEAGASPLRAAEWSSPKVDMAHLPTFEAAAQVGTVVAYDAATLTALQHFGTPKQLGSALSRQPRPRTLLRPHSLALFKDLEAGAEDASKIRTSVLHGPRGAGASTLLVHAVAHTLANDWLVLYMPSLNSLINSTSPYVYDSTHKTYLQPAITQNILRVIGTVNGARLKQLTADEGALAAAQLTSQGAASGSASPALAKSQDLYTLIQTGAADSAPPPQRQLILEVVLQSLARQTSVPVLLAMDDFQALYASSLYRNPDYRRLESYELAVPRVLLQLVRAHASPGDSATSAQASALTAHQAWKLRRGAILGALSEEHVPLSYPSVAKELYTALGLAGTDVAANPFASLNRMHLQHVQDSNLLIRNVMSRTLDPNATLGEALQKHEAAALFDCLKQERGIFSPANDELFLSKLIESGGNLGLFERGLQRTLM